MKSLRIWKSLTFFVEPVVSLGAAALSGGGAGRAARRLPGRDAHVGGERADFLDQKSRSVRPDRGG
jgi:hypothetical protein